MTPEEMECLYDQFEMEDDVNYKFDRILDYEFQDGVLVLKARYYDDDIGKHDLAVPFPILKRDVALELACFIRDTVVEDKCGGHYNLWAKSMLKAHARGVRQLYWSYNADATCCVYPTQRAKASCMSKNARNARATINKNKVKMGSEISRITREALFFDRQQKTTLWADAIFQEMCGLRLLNAFKFHAPNHKCERKDGWQFAPMHMIFDGKQQNMQYKAQLFVGGHMIESSEYTTYSTIIENISVCLLFLAATHQGLDLMTGDISNAFSTAQCAKKDLVKCGPEFGDQEGAIVTLQRAVY
jgi:hypothetical protein